MYEKKILNVTKKLDNLITKFSIKEFETLYKLLVKLNKEFNSDTRPKKILTLQDQKDLDILDILLTYLNSSMIDQKTLEKQNIDFLNKNKNINNPSVNNNTDFFTLQKKIEYICSILNFNKEKKKLQMKPLWTNIIIKIF